MLPGRFAAARLVIPAVIGVTPLVAQTPKPFPSPSPPASPQAPTMPPRPAPGGAAAAAGAPTEAMLGAPIFQGAQFITSYDAGRGQRFYLFGAAAPFLEVVTF